ncbi:hypothetical protein [Methanolapillus ohkumae]|uniref:Uncharacterized protein n=1 Tax=Methanolapillus ohkumae TaxID=3028298 RepID=A0AA96V5M9_9EURY|nr:hypothetical protein MsAm2_09680 [Methanosarcinaceae archaeon Am2]
MSLISPVLGEEDLRKSVENPYTEEETKLIIDSTKQTNPTAFLSYSKNDNILAVYGEVPLKNKGVESYEWWLAISNTVDEIAEDEAFGKYLARNGGSIIGYGPCSEGYIIIQTDQELRSKITQNDLEQIQKIVDKYAEKNGWFLVYRLLKISSAMLFESLK